MYKLLLIISGLVLIIIGIKLVVVDPEEKKSLSKGDPVNWSKKLLGLGLFLVGVYILLSYDDKNTYLYLMLNKLFDNKEGQYNNE